MWVVCVWREGCECVCVLVCKVCAERVVCVCGWCVCVGGCGCVGVEGGVCIHLLIVVLST